MQLNPVKFRFTDFPIRLGEAKAALSEFLSVDTNDVVFVSNVNEAVATVLRSIPLAAGDRVLCLDTEYPANLALLQHLCRAQGASLTVVPVPLPVTDQTRILDAVRGELKLGRVKLCLFDHISSSSALVQPVVELCDAARAAGALSLVDGAHAPGQIPNLRVTEVGADFYAGTLHKWAFACPGTAFLHARADRQAILTPLAVGHDLTGSFESHFGYVGHKDYSPWLAFPEAIRFARRTFGSHDAVAVRNHTLVVAMANMLAFAWGPPSFVVHSPDQVASMSLVTLPFVLDDGCSAAQARALGAALGAFLLQRGVTVPIFDLIINNKRSLVVRISAHVFNEERDYELLANAITELSKDKLFKLSSLLITKVGKMIHLE